MKTITILFFLSILTFSYSQINYLTLDVNNSSVLLSNEGTVFQNFGNVSAGYEIPKGSGLNTIFSTEFWFAGKESDGTIHTSRGGYPGFATDVFKGPFSSTNSYNDPNYQNQWGISMWDICQTDIDIFRQWWECNNGIITNGCENIQEPTPEMLDKIFNWPAHGNINQGESYYMLPYWDYNNDGVYNPNDGDYPIIKGCCAIYIIQNDHAGIHTYSGTQPIGIEMHYMFYQYSTWNYLDNTTFIDVLTINKGTTDYSEFTSGLLMDADVGSFDDDYFGSDSLNNVMLFYNGDNFDQNGYLADPPAIGIVALENKMSTCTPYQTPSNSAEIWNLMNGKKIDAQNWIHPNGYPTTYVYSGNPTNPSAWNETSVGNIPGDRRSIMSNIHGALNSGDSIFQSYAILYARNGNNLQNAQSIINLASEVKTFYDSESNIPCENGTWGTEEINTSKFNVFPNPSKGILNISSDQQTNITVSIFDLSGKQIQTSFIQNATKTSIDLINLPKGLYLIQIETNNESIMKRIILE